jgi:tetratricopeptide (TPR) repeat protein
MRVHVIVEHCATGIGHTMIEWLVAVAPVAFSVLVFGLALGTDPIDISLQEVTTPGVLEERGYAADTIFELLERKIGAIVDRAGSARVPETIEVGTPDTAINAYAEIVNVGAPVRATQRLLDLVDYVAEIHFVAGEDKAIAATVRIRDSNTLRLLKFDRLAGQVDAIEDLLDQIAQSIVDFVDPYIMAAYFYNRSLQDQASYDDLVPYVKQKIMVVDADFLPWFYNLSGQMSEQTGDPALAIEYYKTAIGMDPHFYLAYVNWGHALAGLGREAEAIELYHAALGMKPDLAIARVYLAEALLAREQFEPALAELAQAKAFAPEFAAIYTTRAAIFEQVGLPDLAHRARVRADTARHRQPQQNRYDTL